MEVRGSADRMKRPLRTRRGEVRSSKLSLDEPEVIRSHQHQEQCDRYPDPDRERHGCALASPLVLDKEAECRSEARHDQAEHDDHNYAHGLSLLEGTPGRPEFPRAPSGNRSGGLEGVE